jgi:large subunit ribosomal protein L24
MSTMKIKKGDSVVVIAGKDKGKEGKVMVVNHKDNTVIVEGVNMVTKHTKASAANQNGGIVKQEGPIDASNVLVICPVCGKATRVGYVIVDGKEVRACKKCGASLDVKVEKKEAAKKPATKSTKKAEGEAPVAKKPRTKKAEAVEATEAPAEVKKPTTRKKTVKTEDANA